MKLFDYFVIPFTLGLNILIIYLVVLYAGWIRRMDAEDKAKIKKNIFSWASVKAAWEIFMESLLHRKIFKVNPLLGFMHSGFAFGWFLLIVVGKLEVSVCCSDYFNPPYYAIFFRFFQTGDEVFPYHKAFAFVMDLALLYILTALVLAFVKRMRSKILGMKSTSKLKWKDKVAMYSLWLIFPLRFIAESFTCATTQAGSFLTNNAGTLFASFLPVESLAYPFWWAYSLSLFFFFVALPFSRYMHIPTEMMYIFLKNMGICQGTKFTAFTNFPLYSCSRCGICLDQCQLNTSLGNKQVQSVYFLQRLRNQESIDEITNNCLMCGRCESVCPVGIDLTDIRMSQKKDDVRRSKKAYSYIAEAAEKEIITSDNSRKNGVERTDNGSPEVLFYSGCMGHLNPSAEKAMLGIMKRAGVKYNFIDEDGGICCGRPLKLAGKHKAANELIANNTRLFESTGAKILVTSCPICYRVFKEDYDISMTVIHHTEYIAGLVKQAKIRLRKGHNLFSYHDPCELSRKNALYDEPRSLLKEIGEYNDVKQTKDKALCCGGSLANTAIFQADKTKIAQDAVLALTANKPDVLVTSCPLCKKSLHKASVQNKNVNIPVRDIAEVVVEMM